MRHYYKNTITQNDDNKTMIHEDKETIRQQHMNTNKTTKQTYTNTKTQETNTTIIPEDKITIRDENNHTRRQQDTKAIRQ